jgi:integrase/recombinase XerD
MEEEKINQVRLWVARFREYLRAMNYAERSQYDYPAQLKPFLSFLAVDDVDSLPAVTPETLHRYRMHLFHHKRKEKLLSLATQGTRLVALKGFFRFLYKRGEVLVDPAAGLELPRGPRHLPRGIMTPPEVRRVLNEPDMDTPLGLRDKAILEVLYSTGIRNAELRALAVNDADILNQELHIRQGKGGKDRVVPLGEVAARIVNAYVKESRPRLLKGRPDTGHLFVSVGGRPLLAGNLVWAVCKYVRRAKLKKHVTPHAFRHTCATHMLRGRAGIRHIQELLGHRSIATTQIYTHVEVGDLKREHRRTHPREQAL